MADATLSIATLPATTPVVADASATVAAATASEAGTDPFANLLATLADATPPAATPTPVIPAAVAITPTASTPAAIIADMPTDETAPPSSKHAAKDSDGDTPADADTLAAAIAAGATAVLAMAQNIPMPPPSPAPSAVATAVRAIAYGATPKPADLPIAQGGKPTDQAPAKPAQPASDAAAPQPGAPATGQTSAPKDIAAIVAALKALPAASSGDPTAPPPQKAGQAAAPAVAAAVQAPSRNDHAPPPLAAAGHGAATAQPATDKPARTNDRRTDAVDFTLPGLFTGPRHDAAPLPGDASGVSQAPAPDSIVQQQLSIARDGRWLDTLARDIAQTAGTGNDLHFKLDPQNLGSLTVSIAQGADGAAIRMSTDSADTRNILIDAQPKLVAEARAQGLRISETHVDLSQSNGGSRGDTWGGQSNAQPNGQGQQSSTTRQPFMRNPEPVLAGGDGPDVDPDGLYA
jgi:flagellar hook-length control protein FliK